MNRIFISYRSSDGRKDADRLAQDLSRLFGAYRVFHDRREVRGGHSWHDDIMRVLGERPVVLALVTPDYFGARSSHGLCIFEPEDPVRQELEGALLTRAMVIPLLADQVEMPKATQLPPSLSTITERHTLHLRGSEWEHDIERLSADLQSLGLARRAPQAPPPTSGLGIKPMLGVALASISLLGLVVLVTPGTPPTAEQVLAQHDQKLDDVLEPTAAGETSLTGTWIATLEDGTTVALHVRQHGSKVSLTSDRLFINTDPQAQRLASWAVPPQDTGVKDLHLHGEGQMEGWMLNLTLVLESGDGQRVLDQGNAELLLSEDQRDMSGGVQFSRMQASSLTLKRQ